MGIVRKNLIVFTGTFALPATPSVPAATQPSAVTAYLAYKNQQGQAQTATIAMSYDSVAKTWSGSWDSSVAGAGRVDWMIYGSGALVAAAEGSFELDANAANKV